jgi:MYXO-CTERM domain-containing protein
MKTSLWLILTFAVSGMLSIASSASARPSYAGAGGAIPEPPFFDSQPWGAPGQYFESMINVTDSFSIADVTVSLTGFAHGWQGDLWMRLIGPDGSTSINLIQRAGQGTSTFGFSNNFVGTNSYSWSDAGATSTAFSSPTNIPSGVYRAFSNSNANLTFANSPGPGPATNTLQSFQTIFGGMNSLGNWTLRITDFGNDDIGTLNGWTLNLTEVPAPGAVALLALAGLAPRRRRVC